ncbi:NB-ARC domain-containing protein [Bradyrhizobium sp. UFLA05-109]
MMDISILPAEEVNNIWFKATSSNAAIVFVHGVLSSSRTCWLYEENKKPLAYWPDLINADPRFGNISIFLGGYDSSVDSGGYEIRSCVDELFSALKRTDRKGVASPLLKSKITFVCHSMGGIVVRSMLERYPEFFATKEIGLVLIASPTFGSEYANSLSWLIEFFNNQQGVHLQLGDWSLEDLDNRFRDLKESKKIPALSGIEFYENRFIAHVKWLPIAASKPIVNVRSQGRYFGAPKQIPKSDHFSICKPKSDSAIVHEYLYDFLRDHNLLPSGEPPAAGEELLSQKRKAITSPEENAEGQLPTPNLQYSVTRASAMAQVLELWKRHSVLCVAGLSGNGKTHLVSQLVGQLYGAKKREDAIWFEALKGDTVETLLAACSKYLPERTAESAAGQCKQLIQAVVENQLVLIIDDFHNSDRESYLPLLRAAARQSPPTKLVLISRLYPDELVGQPSTAVFHLGLFTEEEAATLVQQRGLPNLPSELLKELWTKTGGLPLAITWFCTLVKEFGYAPRTALTGELAGIDRLRQWFQEINSLVSEEAAKLLRLLSLTDGSFDRSVVRLLSREILGIDSPEIFYSLNRAFLVESYGADKWRVHDLVADLCRDSLDEKVASAVHRTLGNFYNQISSGWRARPKDEASLQNKIRACKHFAQTGYMKFEAERLVKLIVSELKRKGYYRQLIDLIRPLRHAGGDKWLDYHFGHCFLILRHIPEAIDVAEELIHGDVSDDSNLRLASYRLYAEAIHASGDSIFAERVLSNAIATTSTRSLNAVTGRQAQMILAGLEIKNGKISVARGRLDSSLKQAEAESDERGAAVANTWIGISQLIENKLIDAERSLSLAEISFEKARDMRGLAWALTKLAEAKARLSKPQDALVKLRSASQIYDELDIYDPEYLASLQRIVSDADHEENLSEFVTKELSSRKREQPKIYQ